MNRHLISAGDLSRDDAVLILDAGRVRQRGPVADVFARPADAAVARIVGVETIQPARVVAVADGQSTVAVGTARLTAAAGAVPAECYACIRAEDVDLARGDAPDGVNSLTGVVLDLLPEGAMVRVELDCGFPLTAVLTRQACQALGVRPGDRVAALVRPEAVRLVPPG